MSQSGIVRIWDCAERRELEEGIVDCAKKRRERVGHIGWISVLDWTATHSSGLSRVSHEGKPGNGGHRVWEPILSLEILEKYMRNMLNYVNILLPEVLRSHSK